MRYQTEQKLPEEVELEQKRSELAALRAQQAAAETSLRKVREEISAFEKAYERTLGWRMAELERLEAEIARLTGSGGQQRHQSRGQERWSAGTGGRFWDFPEDTTGQPEREGRSEEQEIKALYREVAKAIHPDLGGTGIADADRHELMSRANRAYAQKDRRVLQNILRTWQRSPGAVAGDGIAAELVRFIRQIARMRQELDAVNAQITELKGSYLCRLKLRIDGDRARGSDLFAEMVAAADLNIARARRRLATLRGEHSQRLHRQEEFGEGYPESGIAGGGAEQAQAGERREICFPVDDFTGTLFLRDRNSANFSQWKKFGTARGCLSIDADKAVRLDVKGDDPVRFSQLRQIKPDDLQSLFLYGVSDSDLENILHLTGLEELYLSGPRLTDAALSGISKLSNLKRIYLYQTVITDRGLAHLQRLPRLTGLTSSGNSITDEGLAVFQKAIPGVKTVSFQWKYGR